MIEKCPFCELNLENKNGSERANHVRWCKLNPKRSEYLNTLCEIRKLLPEHHENYYERLRQEGRPYVASEETREKLRVSMTGRKHSEETKKIISERGLSNLYKRKCKSIVYYNGFRFDSNWEVNVAKILDKHSIKWVQPEPMIWIDKNQQKHHYYSDFYLVDHNIYLDPKNDYCIKVQREKLEYVLENYKNVVILSKEQINEKFILSLIESWGFKSL